MGIRSVRAVVVGAALVVASIATTAPARAAILGPGRYQTANWVTGGGICVGEKTWFQYNNGAAQNMAAYGSWGVSADGLAPHPTITQADPSFYSLSRLGPIATAPSACAHARYVAAGWIASRYHVVKWNGTSWAHCQGVPYYYNTGTAFEMAITTPSAQTGTSAPVLCGSGWYYAEAQSWVWDGAAWQGGVLYQAPAGADWVNVTQNNYAVTRAGGLPASSAGLPPAHPVLVDGQTLSVVDSTGAIVRDSSGQPVSVVVDVGPPRVAGGSTATRAAAAGTRSSQGGSELVLVDPVSDQAKRQGGAAG